MPMTPREMIKHLKKNGFEEIRQNGSHVKMKNRDTEVTVIVPYHSKAMKRGVGAGNTKTGGAKVAPPPETINGGIIHE